MIRAGALGVLLCLACWGQEHKSNPFAGNPREIEAGRSTFRLRCSACHGIRAEGGRGPDLRRREFSAGDTDLDLYRVIASGVPGGEMPAFGSRNTEESIWRIVAYLRSLSPPPDETAAGNPEAGEKVYWGKGGCGGCHRVGAKGGRFGPDLTRIGRSRSRAHLTESVVDPNGDLPPGYFAVTIEMKDGRKLSGVGLGIDNFSVRFIDAQERIQSFLVSEVASIKREFRSLMPGVYGTSLSETERGDLVAYLQSLRGEESRK